MLRTASGLVMAVAMVATGSAWAQGYNGGSGTVAVPNGLSGPGGTMTFSNQPAVQAGSGSIGAVGRVGRAASTQGQNPVLERPGVQSDQRR